MKEKEHIPFIAISDRTTEGDKTGDQAIEIPGLSGKIAPCTRACPIGQPIPEVLNLFKDGKFREAWELLAVRNPLSGSTASVCQGFCEKECNLQHLVEKNKPVAFNKIERFLGKMAVEKGWEILVEEARDVEEKEVAIIGAGPAGLTCACQLAKQGCLVTIYESSGVLGGLMRTAIPEDRLPKDVLKKEINRILALNGISVVKHFRVEEQYFSGMRKSFQDKGGFDAVFVAIGNHKPIKLGLENEDVEGVIYGLDFLKKFNLGEQCDVGRRVTIIGSGNTAIDCALCAIKIPDTKVFVFCEKEWEEIPDFLQKGIRTAQKQRVMFFFGVKVKSIEKNKTGIKRVSFTEVKEDIEKGKFTLCRNTDTLIVALGEERDTSFVPKYFAPRIANVFLGGSVNNVASAVVSGNEGARKIIAFLQGKEYQEPAEQEVVEPEDLNTAYFEEILKIPRNKKITDAKAVQKEAERCLNCGTCIGCKICQQYCPDFSVEISDDEPPKFDDYHCKGCGICANECPRGVIEMRKKEEARLVPPLKPRLARRRLGAKATAW